MTVAVQEPQVQEQEAVATNETLSPILGPPFDGIWTRYARHPAVFWTAHRHFPVPGQVVAQMGTRSADHPTIGDRFEIGLWKRFTPTTSGPHRITFEVSAGPISRIGSVWTSMIAFTSVGGFGSVDLPASRTPYPVNVGFRVDHLTAGHEIRLYCSSKIVSLARPWRTTYGEVIASISKIRVLPLPFGLKAEEPQEGALRGLLEEGGDLDAALKVLAEKDPGQQVVNEELSLTEAYKLGEQSFTTLNGAEA